MELAGRLADEEFCVEKSMGSEQAVSLFRNTMQMALLMGAPLLAVAVFISLLVNVAQVLTSLQDQTLSTVPRLAAVAAAILKLNKHTTKIPMVNSVFFRPLNFNCAIICKPCKNNNKLCNYYCLRCKTHPPPL